MKLIKVLVVNNTPQGPPSRDTINNVVECHVRCLVQDTCIKQMCKDYDCYDETSQLWVHESQIWSNPPRDFTDCDYAFQPIPSGGKVLLVKVFPFTPWLLSGEKTTPNPLFSDPDLVRFITIQKEHAQNPESIDGIDENVIFENKKVSLVRVSAEVDAENYHCGFYGHAK